MKSTLAVTASLNWSVESAMSAWDGVTLGGTPRRVTQLRLENRGLNGNIPAELGNLAGLERLELGSNRLTGSIPSSLGRLTHLTYLELESNRLTGPIPPELGNLAALQTLDLRGSGLSGPIPPELDNLGSLETLDLSSNRNLSGCIPLALYQQLANLDVPERVKACDE